MCLMAIILLTHSVISHSGSAPSMEASSSAISPPLVLWVQFHFQVSNLDQKSARCSDSAPSNCVGREGRARGWVSRRGEGRV